MLKTAFNCKPAKETEDEPHHRRPTTAEGKPETEKPKEQREIEIRDPLTDCLTVKRITN